MKTNKHILVTGAAGFIGGAVVQHLLDHELDVSVLVNRSIPATLKHLADDQKIHLIQASVCDSALLEERIRSLHEPHAIDVIVHCAGRASDTGRDRCFRDVNYQGTINVTQSMKALEIAKLVYVSTTDVYGLKDFQGADETTPFDNNVKNPYPKYKILSELYLKEHLSPERFVILRPAAVWGPGDTTITPRIIQFLKSTPFIIHFGRWRGKNRWPLVHINTVCNAVRLAAALPSVSGEAYNLIDPDHVSIDQFYRRILQRVVPEKSAMRSITLPLWMGCMIGQLSTTLSNLFNRHDPLFDPTLYGMYSVSRNLDFSGAKMERLLEDNGVSISSFEENVEAFTLHENQSPN